MSKTDAPLSRKVDCPQCGTPTDFSPTNATRPFCSERCKLIDLGEWAEEKFRIPTEDQPSHESEEF